jgi:hypothetical protein
MSGPRDPDAIIAAWLDEGPAVLPGSTRRAIAVASRSTNQARRPVWWPWRVPNVNGLTRPIVAVVTVVVLAVGGLFVLNRNPSGPGGVVAAPSPTPQSSPAPSASPAPIASPSQAPPVTPSPTQPPVSFTSPLYGYTVSWPPGGGWAVTPATVHWQPGQDPIPDAFLGPAGAYQDYDDVYVAAQPVPEGMTSDAWLLDYAQHVAASGRDCKGPVDAWTNAAVGSLAIRRLDLVCQEIRLTEVAFVVGGTGYVMSGNREVVALFLDTFQPGA